MEKQRTRAHIIADLSVNFVERLFLLSGHTAQRVEFDYGYDLFVQTFDEQGFLEADFLLVQMKASDAPRYVATATQYAVTVERQEMESWRRNAMPLFLVLYNAATEEAFWLNIQQYEGEPAPRSVSANVTLRVPVANKMSASAVEAMRREKNRVSQEARR